jgi:hypothetical protein
MDPSGVDATSRDRRAAQTLNFTATWSPWTAGGYTDDSVCTWDAIADCNRIIEERHAKQPLTYFFHPGLDAVTRVPVARDARNCGYYFSNRLWLAELTNKRVYRRH